MKEITVPPKAAALSESMRDVGYSLEAAVADIIDNSISATASKVDIFFSIENSAACLAIIDNGCGMTESELIEAMRHGTGGPKIRRSKDDLGRFGLGLKTASFSQCTRLTVASAKNSSRSGAVWDLDLVFKRDDWVVGMLNDAEVAALPYIDRLADDGTLVLWENLDRLCESDSDSINESLLYEKIREVERHLSLVFHRFLNGEIKGRKKLGISINNHDIEPFDPFCTGNKATQHLNSEIIRIHGNEVSIQPYVLPHHSKLSQKERDFYKDRSDFLNNQGAYVYRNGRLMSWGDWFRLVPKGEATKLARVRIDFPNSLDEYWTIDIKKSRAYPPHPIREQLKKIIGRISDGSIRVHKGKGARLYDSMPKPIWLRIAKEGTIEYSLDKEHPIISAIMKSLEEREYKSIHELLSLIESSIPVERIYADYATDPQDFERKADMDRDEVLKRLEDVWNILSVNQKITEESFREVVCSLKPYSDFHDVIDEFIRRKFDERSRNHS